MNRKFLKFSLAAIIALATSYQAAKADDPPPRGPQGQEDAKHRIWRVNNNSGIDADFTTLTAALRELNDPNGRIQAGDTIHLEGSVTPYGKANTATDVDSIRRRVVLIGPGFFLSDNPETQHNKESAKIRTIHIAPTAGGTVIAGLEQVAPAAWVNYQTGFLSGHTWLPTLYQTVSTNNHNWAWDNNWTTWGNNAAAFKLRIEADSVTVSHCKLFYVDLFNRNRELTNITITKCLFSPGMIAAAAGTHMVRNLIISNNFFRNDYHFTTYSHTHAWTFLFAYLVINLRHTGPAFNPNVGNWNVAGDANWRWCNDNAWFTYTAVVPIIQNNTFYHAFNIAAKGANLFNNLFFPSYSTLATHAMAKFGLPQDPARPHNARNNIIFSGVHWGAQSVNLGYSGNYGGMLAANGNFYVSTPGAAGWFQAPATDRLDNSFQLSTQSPARDGGDAARQRGMFGGLSPYKLSGLFTIPAVWEISIPAYPSGEVPSTGFEVRVQVRSH